MFLIEFISQIGYNDDIKYNEVKPMNPQELFTHLKELIANRDIEGAKTFFEENKDSFGEYYEQAKGLVNGADGANGALDSVKGLFGK